MDLERGIVKALFYDYDPQIVMEQIEKDKDGLWLLEKLPQTMKWHMKSFDETDLKEVKVELVKNCEDKYIRFENSLWPLLYVSEFAGNLLIMDKRNRMPKVKFNQMLRWKELTRFVGEDLLTLSWLAKTEIDKEHERQTFTWEDQIPIQKNEWNEYVGRSSLIDLHAHLGTSADAFVIRWVYWMNNCWKNPNYKRERRLCCIAAIIRYYIFRIVNEGHQVTDVEKKDILDAIHCSTIFTLLMDQVYSQFDSASHLSMKPNIDGIEHWDYAIKNDWNLAESTLESPYMLLAGERKLMYDFLKKLYQSQIEATGFGQFFYLYLLIKVDYRKSFVHTNRLIGLSNYQAYKNMSDEDCIDHFGEPKRRYAIQTSLGASRKNRIEARISWNFKKKDDAEEGEEYEDGKDSEEQPLLNVRVHQSLFGNKSYNKREMLERVTLVVTNSKRKYRWERRTEYLHQLKQEFDEIIKRKKRNLQLKGKDAALVGIDFSSSDRLVRPEVYAALIRYARKNGFYCFTYHAGEDFFDLMDGLRTIDEILTYLKWDSKCRLGHAFSLGVNPYIYYKERGRNAIAKKQVLLDNLAWYLSKKESMDLHLSSKSEREIMKEIRVLYDEIGYSRWFDLGKYQKSMKLRGDLLLDGMEANDMNDFAACAVNSDDAELETLRRDVDVKMLFEEYSKDEDIHKKGSEIVHWKMPKGVEQGIIAIRKALLDKIAGERVAIETCPTSNYQIGPFSKYDELPLKMFLEKLPRNAVSINTDDKGIIQTSIENEYAVMAAAMHKKGYSKSDIKSWMQRVSKDAQRSRF